MNSRSESVRGIEPSWQAFFDMPIQGASHSSPDKHGKLVYPGLPGNLCVAFIAPMRAMNAAASLAAIMLGRSGTCKKRACLTRPLMHD